MFTIEELAQNIRENKKMFFGAKDVDGDVVKSHRMPKLDIKLKDGAIAAVGKNGNLIENLKDIKMESVEGTRVIACTITFYGDGINIIGEENDTK